MSYQSITYRTSLSEQIIKEIEEEFALNVSISQSTIKNQSLNNDNIIRKSKNGWISTNHWLSGFIWFYVQKANSENFLYDIDGIENDVIQYCKYDVGDYYSWHTDYSISSTSNSTRKISFIIQITNPLEYEGGEVQFIDENDRLYHACKDVGSVILFDSRTKHRVKKIRRGVRKSIVGWVVGPRWR
jgi:hypothetical protein